MNNIQEKPLERNLKKQAIILCIAGLVIVFFASGLRQCLTLEYIRELQARFREIYNHNPLGVITLIGATLAGILSRYLLRDWVQRKFRNRYCKKFKGNTLNTAPDHPEQGCSPGLGEALRHMETSCTNCGACTKQCAFLQEYGTPLDIIKAHDFSRPGSQKPAFECSLCSLCQAVCPENLDPCSLFLSIRRQAAGSNHVDFSRYKAILGYEKRGHSRLFSYYGLPGGCDTVFFPGCTLPGTRPETTWKLFRHIEKRIPRLGVVLDCCSKPSHDLGRQAYFESVFGSIIHHLAGSGVKTIVTACPNCHKMFRQYASHLDVKTAYEMIDPKSFPAMIIGNRELTVHDPCPMRDETHVPESVRNLLTAVGIPFIEMEHRGKKTLCCGEGGSVGFVRPGLAGKWRLLRQKEAAGRTVVAYCAGCAGFLGRAVPTLHIADILFSPDEAFTGRLRIARAPFTYLNRLKLKQRFKKALET